MCIESYDYRKPDFLLFTKSEYAETELLVRDFALHKPGLCQVVLFNGTEPCNNQTK